MSIKKVIFSLAWSLLVWNFTMSEAVAFSFPEGAPHTFTITGYYSPLPGQNFYITGDYASEIRLNGKGTHGADGTPVYPGMMAASSNFGYGTKICIPGFGCGAVHDRGQAIVKKGERPLAQHDRLDVWMGYGEEGLLRALSWGVKHVECEIFSASSPVVEAVNFEAALPLAQVLDLPPKPFFAHNLEHGMEGLGVIGLQEALKNLGLYEGILDGRYDYDVRQSVLKFQRKHFIVQKEGDLGAGVFGPQTREKLAEEIYRYEIQKRIREAWESFHFEESLERGAKNADVLRLQEILVQEEFLTAYPTGYFGPKTEQALKDFQLHYGIIEYEKALGAGKVGPATLEKLNQLLTAKKESINEEGHAVLVYQKKRDKLSYLVHKNFYIASILSQGVKGESVERLQQALGALGYFSDAPTGIYELSTQRAVQQFQLDYGVIASDKDRGAGVFGPRTQEVLQQVLQG